jgi:ectoine hydroxylase-related dioxygenase (phytanoyl-CoA dioxygenase family)
MKTNDHLAHYHEHGYAVVKGVFDPDEVAELAAAFDRTYAQGLAHGRPFRHGNTFYNVTCDATLGPVMRMMQWPAYIDPVLNRFRLDKRMHDIVAPLIGSDLKQIINQMHWKPPGASMVEFGYHQDIRSRRPRTAYRDPASSYIQTAIAVDPHRRENGAMTFYSGSHLLGELPLSPGVKIMDTEMSEDHVAQFGLEPDQRVDLELDPGDVGFWDLYTIHGSGPNVSNLDRRVYLNGYVTAANCDRGEWTFRGGVPCPLGEPVLVHYEELHERPEPHYVDD